VLSNRNGYSHREWPISEKCYQNFISVLMTYSISFNSIRGGFWV
jgi:hypothetical protein